MLTNFDRTANWLKACGKTPSDDALSVQIGCHLEEFCEFLAALSADDESYAKLLERTRIDLEWVAGKIKRRELEVRIPEHMREAALDALCDTEVTGNGVAYLAGFAKVHADELVLDSNDAKLVNGRPVLLAGGKIGKPESWRAPDLRGCV